MSPGIQPLPVSMCALSRDWRSQRFAQPGAGKFGEVALDAVGVGVNREAPDPSPLYVDHENTQIPAGRAVRCSEEVAPFDHGSRVPWPSRDVNAINFEAQIGKQPMQPRIPLINLC